MKAAPGYRAGTGASPRGRRTAAAAGLSAAWACAVGGALIGLQACLGPFADGGDASETGNALAGTLILEGGAAASGARVTLVPEGYNPVTGGSLPDSLTDVAGGNGAYRIDAPPGRYNLEALHPATGRRLFIRRLDIADAPLRRAKDTVRAPGSLALARPDWLPKEGGFFFVPGTTFRMALEKARSAGSRLVFDSLPPARFGEVRFVPGIDDTASLLLASEVAVRGGAVEPVHPFAAWEGSARVVLNTSAAGVPIEKDLADFPLLVRLAAPGFDIAAAQPDGRDLRFAKPDGTPLPFVLESWGPGGGLAWVRVDTVRAGEASQHITLHWGHPQADMPPSSPVFDTAAGFAGVWHLGEEASDTVANGLYRDATPAGNHGNDRLASADRPGVVGQGHAFARGDYIQVPAASAAVRLPGRYTLSAWFRSRQQSSPMGGELISVGDNFGLRLTQAGRLQTFFWPVQAPPAGQDPWYNVGTLGSDFLDGAWHLAQGSYDGAVLRLCLDGKEMAAQAVPGPVDFKFGLNVTLGRHGNGKSGFEFTGDLDEVQIHSRARGVDWNRLSYENQRPGSDFPVLAAP
jgi:hypothetical protein